MSLLCKSDSSIGVNLTVKSTTRVVQFLTLCLLFSNEKLNLIKQMIDNHCDGDLCKVLQQSKKRMW